LTRSAATSLVFINDGDEKARLWVNLEQTLASRPGSRRVDFPAEINYFPKRLRNPIIESERRRITI